MRRVTARIPTRAQRASRWLAPVAAALLLAAQYPGAVTADHGDRPVGSFLECNDRVPPRCVSVGNNNRHFVLFDPSLTPELASALRDSMAEDYDPTDLRMYEQRALTPATDVIAYSADYGENGAAGWVNCPRDSPQGVNGRGDRWCQHQELRLNLNPRYSIFFEDEASRDHVACHELGHTLGFRHWGNPPQSEGPDADTCMNANTPDGPAQLHQFDEDHIDDYYGDPPRRLVWPE